MISSRRSFASGNSSQSGTGWGSGNIGGGVTPDWELLRDFNSGTIGTAPNGTADGFTTGAASSLYTTEQVFEGAQACKVRRLNADGPGFGEYGGIITFPSPAVEGESIWLDIMVYFGDDAPLSIMRVYSKFLRLRRSTNTGTGADHLDIYFSRGIRSAFMFQAISEGTDGSWHPGGVWENLTQNTWHRVTAKWTMGAVAAASGGTGSLQVWHNTQRIINTTTMRTLEVSTDRATDFYCTTQYDYPTDTTELAWYVDRIRIAKNGIPSWAVALEGVS